MTLLGALRGELVHDCYPLFVHAHPDDETLQTGPLIAWCRSRRILADVVTCTRGEKGEVVPGALPATITTTDLVRVRGRELAEACRILGVNEHHFLGEAPARAPGEPPRRYRDSGMVWVAQGLAGPAETNEPDTFTSAPIDEAVADLVALITVTEPTLLVGYDRQGSYGHPDYIRAHEITVEAAKRTGLPMIEVASDPDDAGFEWFDLPETHDLVTSALGCYATQLSVRDGQIVHVGGQTQPISTRIGLRRLVPG